LNLKLPGRFSGKILYGFSFSRRQNLCIFMVFQHKFLEKVQLTPANDSVFSRERRPCDLELNGFKHRPFRLFSHYRATFLLTNVSKNVMVQKHIVAPELI
jgi:hypothetical protein